MNATSKAHRLLILNILGSALLSAADPGYLTVSLNKVMQGKAGEYNEYQKKVDAFYDGRGGTAPGTTQFVRMRRAYPPGAEHGYNRVSLTFLAELPELDPAKAPNIRLEFLKFAGWTSEELNRKLEGIYERDSFRGRFYREVASIGAIRPGDWIRLNWIRSNPGRHVTLREANLKYNKVAAQKYIDQGVEKGWMLFELPFPTDEKDYDLLRIHVFSDSKAAQTQLPGMQGMFPSDEWAKALESFRGSAQTTRVEIYQVERSVPHK